MVFTFQQKILFKHCDPAGIVFYPRYFEVMNDCVEAFFDQALGAPFETLHRSAAVPTARIATNFHAPSRHGDHLTLTLSGDKLGRASFDYEMHAVCKDEPRFTTQATLVYIDQSGRPQPWPDDLRTPLSDYVGEPS